MTDEVETTPWERLRRLYATPPLEQPGHARQWANELMSQLGMDLMPGLSWTAYRDTISAVLLSLIRSQSSDQDTSETDRPDAFTSQTSDASITYHHAEDVPPPVIRAWAHQRGITIGDRGRIPMWITHQYYAEHAQEAQPAPGLGTIKEENEVAALDPDVSSAAPDSKLEDFLKALHGESNNN